MTLADEIHKLDQLRRSGALTDEEYVKAKARLLDARHRCRTPRRFSAPPDNQPTSNGKPANGR